MIKCIFNKYKYKSHNDLDRFVKDSLLKEKLIR